MFPVALSPHDAVYDSIQICNATSVSNSVWVHIYQGTDLLTFDIFRTAEKLPQVGLQSITLMKTIQVEHYTDIMWKAAPPPP